MSLSKKQKVFAREYSVDHNGAQAAIRAGYAEPTAKNAASRLLANVAVKQLVAKLDAEKSAEAGVDAAWVLQRWIEVFEKSFEGAPQVWKGEPVTVVLEGVETVVTEWSPSGANLALQGIAKLIGASVSRSEVEVTGAVVYTLTLDRDLSDES